MAMPMKNMKEVVLQTNEEGYPVLRSEEESILQPAYILVAKVGNMGPTLDVYTKVEDAIRDAHAIIQVQAVETDAKYEKFDDVLLWVGKNRFGHKLMIEIQERDLMGKSRALSLEK